MPRLAAGITGLFVVMALLVPQRASAEPFIDLGAGLVVPLAEEDWTDFVDASAILSVRGGAITSPSLGFMASLDYSPFSEDVRNVDVSRVRLMGHVMFVSQRSSKMMMTGRIGAGIDNVKLKVEIFGNVAAEDSDTGFALEGAIGGWFAVSPSVFLGIEGAVPIAYHSDDDNPDVDLTTIDLIALFGARIML
jgi:hypothetical protein